ncbi:M15 family metallopeptidase [Lacinutrix neustonica]|uniref:D-alanyl-D-alanine dipeptidase n=1 Tax=Lacinutrix neustonica TaxID=2980107 RepID=A0A9E8MX55_9FLAO|nr:M15 family metallopeptidase [Lacinutrix neustonica]WAC03307.1 M15 family metallopeptidase [Lacinutrix neustonica]
MHNYREGFVYVKDVIPTIQTELRYCGTNNFVGTPIDGYVNSVAILTLEAAAALKKAQTKLAKQNLSILIYDAYRPQAAVNHFVRWAKVERDTLMKGVFYPDVQKKNLFKEGYIASKSRHSSGSTLDITIANLETGIPLDMGSPYDFFGSASWIKNSNLNTTQRVNRQLLQKVMADHGFRNYAQEWWHFTLRGEPYRNQYFDFFVE